MDAKFSNILIFGLVGAAWALLESDASRLRRAKAARALPAPRGAPAARKHLRIVASHGQILSGPTLVWSR